MLPSKIVNSELDRPCYIEIVPFVQDYAWGRKPSDSFITQLVKNNKKNCNYSRFAELWIGVHPSGLCYVPKFDCLVDKLLEKHQTLKQAQNTLLKVLSIDHPLSIQLHPNKIQAERLHKQFPDIYKDSNHKPEMAVALMDFEALCGFKNEKKIKINLKKYTELYNVFSPFMCDANFDNEANLQTLFRSLMTASELSPKELTGCIESLVNSLKLKNKLTIEEELILRLNNRFPNDVGVLSPLFLNYFALKAGEAIFIPPNCLHCYLSGECVEIMSNSDNCVRGGLTGKKKDVTLLLELINYEEMCIKNCLMFPSKSLISNCPSIKVESYVTDYFKLYFYSGENCTQLNDYTLDFNEEGIKIMSLESPAWLLGLQGCCLLSFCHHLEEEDSCESDENSETKRSHCYSSATIPLMHKKTKELTAGMALVVGPQTTIKVYKRMYSTENTWKFVIAVDK